LDPRLSLSLMSLDDTVSPSPGEQVQDCHQDRVPSGGVTAAVELECTQDHVKSIVHEPMVPDRQSSNLSRTKPPPAIMPPVDLVHNIPLHSPTPIVGTPFDVTANYEYPFPPDHDHHHHPSSSVPTIPSPILTSRPPSTGSQHLLSGSPPPHIVKSISPPPVSASYTFSLTHLKMRSREPPVPPGLITKRRRISEARSASNDSIRSGSDVSEDASPMSRGSAVSRSADSSPAQDTRNSTLWLRERKKEREVIGDGSVDLSRNVRINEAEAVDAAATDRRESRG